MSDALLDILYITPDILGEGLDRIKVVKENIAGVVQDAVKHYTAVTFLELSTPFCFFLNKLSLLLAIFLSQIFFMIGFLLSLKVFS